MPKWASSKSVAASDVIAEFFAAEAAKEAATAVIDLLKLPNAASAEVDSLNLPKAASAEVDLLNLPKTVRLRYSIHLLFKKFNVFSFENNDAKRLMSNKFRNYCHVGTHLLW